MMKKLIAMALAVILVLSCTVAAFAVENVTNGKVVEDGTITITGANENYDYAVYKLLHMDTCDTDTGVCTYKVEDAWAGFFATQEALTYVSIDGSGNVSPVDGIDYVQFGKATLDYAKANGIAPEAVNSDGSGVFTGLSLGYYLVDVGVGTLYGLSIFQPDGCIVVKNHEPEPALYGIDLYNVNADSQPLLGAEFQLLDENQQQISLVYNTATGSYRCGTEPMDDEEMCNNTIRVSNANGVTRVLDLEQGTYYLHQTKAPDGYAMLSDDREFSITDSDLFVEYDGDTVLEGSSVCLINPQGATLPDDPTDETTTPSTNEEKKSQSENTETDNSIVPVLIAVIAVLVAVILVAGVVLIAKKRKSA